MGEIFPSNKLTFSISMKNYFIFYRNKNKIKQAGMSWAKLSLAKTS